VKSSAAGDAPRGLYAITPDSHDTATLVAQVTSAISGGARFVQYRNKEASPQLRTEQARALTAACRTRGAFLIVNDDVELARDVGADGVHIGAEDASIENARATLGIGKLIGVSCYNRLDLAYSAQQRGADYIAFGSFFPSQVKPGAVHAPAGLLREAKSRLNIPIVAIGGITVENARELVHAGADAVAVITALFAATDITAAARDFTALFSDAAER